MLEGGSRVPFIASWPASTPKGKVSQDIVSFADPYTTFAEIAGVKPPEGFKTDGHSIAPQLHGEQGKPRDWAYVQLDGHWYVREPGFKMNEAHELFNMSDAPFVEKLVAAADDTPESKAARKRLTAILEDLNPAGGKTDKGGQAPRNRQVARGSATATGPWKSGDSLPGAQAPAIGGKTLEITAEIDPAGSDGVIVTQGGGNRGYAIYLKEGKITFAVRRGGTLTTISAKKPIGSGHFTVKATLGAGGAMSLFVDGKEVAEGKAGGLIGQQPNGGLWVGDSGRGAVGDYSAPNPFKGKVANVRVKAGGGQ
jgi:hypothetical protein